MKIIPEAYSLTFAGFAVKIWLNKWNNIATILPVWIIYVIYALLIQLCTVYSYLNKLNIWTYTSENLQACIELLGAHEDNSRDQFAF